MQFIFISGFLLTIGIIILGGTLMIIVGVAFGFVSSVIFTCAVFIGVRHMWTSCSKHVKAWINQCRFQCWEHASYKEVWQSDRTSEPEELHPEHGAKSINQPKTEPGNGPLKTE